jgi:nucleoside-specific outer membrane channel protein Tsx
MTLLYIRIMKKVLLAAMILLAGASFTSCSSSDDDDNEKQEQKFDASKVMSGKWKLSKIQDFPIPINHYSIQKGNTISFLSIYFLLIFLYQTFQLISDP